MISKSIHPAAFTSNSTSSSSASANGSGNGASSAGDRGVKIADNQLLQLQQQVTQQHQSSTDFPGVNNMHNTPQQQGQHLKHPEVPMRANGGTATIRLVVHNHSMYSLTSLTVSYN